MSGANENWSPQMREGMKMTENMKELRQQVEKGPQPKPGIVGNLLRLFGQSGEIAENLNNSRD